MIYEKCKEFEKNYLKEIEKKYLKNFSDNWNLHREQYVTLLKKQLAALFEMIATIQENVNISVGCIQISLLRSTMKEEHVQFMYEVYDAGREYGKVLLAKTYNMDTIPFYLGQKRDDISKSIQNNSLSAYLSEAAIDCLLYDNYSDLLKTLYTLLKYEFREVDQNPIFQKIKIEYPFFISFGEYRGAYQHLYVKEQAVDIFEEKLRKDFRYVEFEECIYQEKRIAKIGLKGAKFKNCVFKNVTFFGNNLSDVEFIQCSLLNCTFEKNDMHGIMFTGCKLSKNRFAANHLESGYVEVNHSGDIYRRAYMINCMLHQNECTEQIAFEEQGCENQKIMEIESK